MGLGESEFGRSNKFMGLAPVPAVEINLAKGTVSAFGMEVLNLNPHEERRCSNTGPTQGRISPGIL